MQKIRCSALTSAQPSRMGSHRVVAALGIAAAIVVAPFSFKGKNVLLDHAALRSNNAHAQEAPSLSFGEICEQMKSDKISELDRLSRSYKYSYDSGSRTYNGWYLSADEWGIHVMARTCIDHVNGTRCVDSECKKRKPARVCDAWDYGSAFDIKYGDISEVTHKPGTRLITIHMKNGRKLSFRISKYDRSEISQEVAYNYSLVPDSEHAANLANKIRETATDIASLGCP